MWGVTFFHRVPDYVPCTAFASHSFRLLLYYAKSATCRTRLSSPRACMRKNIPILPPPSSAAAVFPALMPPACEPNHTLNHWESQPLCCTTCNFISEKLDWWKKAKKATEATQQKTSKKLRKTQAHKKWGTKEQSHHQRVECSVSNFVVCIISFYLIIKNVRARSCFPGANRKYNLNPTKSIFVVFQWPRNLFSALTVL